MINTYDSGTTLPQAEISSPSNLHTSRAENSNNVDPGTPLIVVIFKGSVWGWDRMLTESTCMSHDDL